MSVIGMRITSRVKRSVQGVVQCYRRCDATSKIPIGERAEVEEKAEEMKAEDIKTLADLLCWIRLYGDAIYVRENVNGEWTHALDSLPPDKWAKHVARFVEDGRIPHRVLPDDPSHKEAEGTGE